VCGAPAEEGSRFCGECGADLGAVTRAGVARADGDEPASPVAPATERRLVSVLFADLVGFTTLSERRDPEEVRDLLTGYFEVARQIIARYGGTIEKFIGDAVMAVWGTPTAREDDAERAVRAALELTAAVPALGLQAGIDGLRLRAGVATGESAVTLAASGQGMVAGDIVNTASRIQTVAPGGGVLVGDATRRATEASIAYEEPTTHLLKGRSEPVQLWRATRVVGGIRGALRTSALEAPFVGRDGELRLVKELFHTAVEEGRARLVSVLGVAGIGKSRLSWEFEKYVDGLAGDIFWHRGRCLAYGEGITYWALAEMVRVRADIAEGEAAETAMDKLRGMLERHVSDPDERHWLEPRLGRLVALEEWTGSDRGDLFSAWRLFFERLSTTAPTVMVFEDIQWADAGLLDFIEYLLDWSRGHPLFVMTLARPELDDRRSTWGSGRRNFTSLYLEPLPAAAMEDLLTGLVPGLPDEVRRRIQERAEGVPLYAVETVRMLLDRGVLQRQGNAYVLTAPVHDLAVPETLHALIAARLDALERGERGLLQDAAVLGQTFSLERLAALTGRPQADIEPILSSLVRKELLAVQLDAFAPDRGQHTFLQALVRKVAYDTLPRHQRKLRHLEVASQLSSAVTHDTDEVVEVIAAHYLAAYRIAPDDPDAEETRENARDALVRAGRRAASLGAPEDAQHYYEQAAELSTEPLLRAELLERAGEMGERSGRGHDATIEQFESAIQLFTSQGRNHPAARVSARLGEAMWNRGHLEEAVERMAQSFDVLATEDADADLATLAAQLARFLFFMGQRREAAERLEVALELAEALRLPEVLSHALNTKYLILIAEGRPVEATALLKEALHIALENDLPSAALRAYYNLADRMAKTDRFIDALSTVDKGLALARQRGDRFWERSMLGQAIYSLYATGRWNEALAAADAISDLHILESARVNCSMYIGAGFIHVKRGDVARAREVLNLPPVAALETSGDFQDRAAFAAATAAVLRAEGRYEEALRSGERAFDAVSDLGPGEQVQEGFIEGVEAAFSLGDIESVARLLERAERIKAMDLTRFHGAQVMRFRARLAALRGESERVEPAFKAAAATFGELGTPFWLAVVNLEQAEWLVAEGRADEAGPLLNDAAPIFAELDAAPWSRRLQQGERAAAVVAPT
jgi:class 3 adenylate cyclase/predicted ATPase